MNTDFRPIRVPPWLFFGLTVKMIGREWFFLGLTTRVVPSGGLEEDFALGPRARLRLARGELRSRINRKRRSPEAIFEREQNESRTDRRPPPVG